VRGAAVLPLRHGSALDSTGPDDARAREHKRTCGWSLGCAPGAPGDRVGQRRVLELAISTAALLTVARCFAVSAVRLRVRINRRAASGYPPMTSGTCSVRLILWRVTSLTSRVVIASRLICDLRALGLAIAIRRFGWQLNAR